MTSKFRLIFLLALQAAMMNGCGKDTSDNSVQFREYQMWKTNRVRDLRKEDGWLSLAGLFWLKQGGNGMGSDSSNDIIFPAGKSPKHAGSLLLHNDRVELRSDPGSGIRVKDSPVTDMVLKTDESKQDGPTMVTMGDLTFYIIKRGEKFGVRIKDRNHAALKNFLGLEYFSYSGKWRVQARFEPYKPEKLIPIVNILNQTSEEVCPGSLIFEIDEASYRLDPIIEKGAKDLFIIFSDLTSGSETYGMGRFLTASLPDSNNNVIIDFNRAYNPPCAFTEYATCPLPPAQNRLNLRIESGEKKYGQNVR